MRFHLLSVMVRFLEMKVVVTFFVVFFVVRLCTVAVLASTKLSFTNWFRLLDKSWKATTQKCLKNVILSRKSLNVRKKHLLVLSMQVAVTWIHCLRSLKLKVKIHLKVKISSNFMILMDSRLN
ncbi:hypothetical protein SAM_0836 [Streptococcus agalactiae CJB111]|nr:hypothetical protein SAM_0836 [Streptococcus agalactiae CJB111]